MAEIQTAFHEGTTRSKSMAKFTVGCGGGKFSSVKMTTDFLSITIRYESQHNILSLIIDGSLQAGDFYSITREIPKGYRFTTSNVYYPPSVL